MWGDRGRAGSVLRLLRHRVALVQRVDQLIQLAWCGESGRYGETRGDMGRLGETWGDMGRYGEIRICRPARLKQASRSASNTSLDRLPAHGLVLGSPSRSGHAASSSDSAASSDCATSHPMACASSRCTTCSQLEA